MSSYRRYSVDSNPGETEPLDNPNNDTYNHAHIHSSHNTQAQAHAHVHAHAQAHTRSPQRRAHDRSTSRHRHHKQQELEQQSHSTRYSQIQSPQHSPERSQQRRIREQGHSLPPPPLPPPPPQQLLNHNYPPLSSSSQNTSTSRHQSRHSRRSSRSPRKPAIAIAIATTGNVELGTGVGIRPKGGAAESLGLGDNITPGADNFSKAAAGGIPALAYSIAERNPRESGVGAMSGYDQHQHQQPPPPPLHQPYPQAYQRAQPQSSPYDQPPDPTYDYSGGGYDHPGYDQTGGYDSSPSPAYESGYASGQPAYDASSHSSHSLGPMSAAGASGTATPTRSHHSYQSYGSDPFGDPHSVYSQRMDPSLGNLHINPNEIDDDGDDGLEYRRPARNSMLSTGNSNNSGATAAAGAAAGGAAAGAAVGGLMGKSRNSQISYNPVANAGPGGGAYDLGSRAEKPSDWAAKRAIQKKRRKWAVIIAVGILIMGAIVGSVVGTVAQNKKFGVANPSSQTADDDTAKNGDLDINSDEIKKLMNNPDLHKVFPGVDYTPINVQYPDCLKSPASQNNITRDVAVLSQLTNTIRLYGTDCNQTQMTIHALEQLELKDEIKIWMGVWQDGNDTTNKRQLEQMWTILDAYGSSYFKGIIVANEILFRKEMTASELGTLLDTVRSNLSDHNWDLPVATSDLGDDWTAELAKVSDYIMANIHPFFAGVNAKTAASWTYSFWQNQNAQFFKTDATKNIISEVGWPTKGGTDCGTDAVTDCPDGSVAGIDELNQLLDDWVCPALTNGTEYFWFEMFDEPWKIRFNEDGKEWEDQWGIMDVNRNLKAGVKIPDCGGKTVP